MTTTYVQLQVPKAVRDRLRLIAAVLSSRHEERVTMADILSDAVALLAAQHLREEEKPSAPTAPDSREVV